MIKNYIKNITVLVVLNLLIYFLHQSFIIPQIEIKSPSVVNTEMSYFINIIASLSICFAILFFKKKHEEQIGFIFLGLSIIKMIFLFFLINPKGCDGSVSKLDAFAFFIPFGINLVLELIFIVKLLNISDLTKELKK